MRIRAGQIRALRRRRDPRVAVRGLVPVRSMDLAKRIAAFVRRLLDRYAGGAGSWSPMQAILKRPVLISMTRPAAAARVILAPRLCVTVRREAVGGALGHRGAVGRRGPPEGLPGAHPAGRLATSAVRSAPQQSDLVRSTAAQVRRPALTLVMRRSQARARIGVRQDYVGRVPEQRRTVGPARYPEGVPGAASTGKSAMTPLRVALQRTESDRPVGAQTLAPALFVVKRVASRGERIEPWSPSALPASGGAVASGSWMSSPRVVPIPRVVHRPVAPPPPAEQQVTRATRTPIRPSAPSAQAGTAPIDVERLTTEVVRVIDRRILAQRERFGRI